MSATSTQQVLVVDTPPGVDDLEAHSLPGPKKMRRWKGNGMRAEASKEEEEDGDEDPAARRMKKLLLTHRYELLVEG